MTTTTLTDHACGTFDRESLARAWGLADGYAPKRSPKAILTNVLVELRDDGTATLSATDLEQGITVPVDGVSVASPGRLLLPVERFGPWLALASDDDVTIRADDRCVTVRCGRSETRLPLADPDDYPRVDHPATGEGLTVSGRQFRELVKRTAYATDPTSPRFAFGGLLLEFGTTRLDVVGTDSRRLCHAWCDAVPTDGFTAPGGTTILPTRSCRELEKVVPDTDAVVTLAVEGNDLVARWSGVTVSCRLLEGRFPAWRGAIPAAEKYPVRLEVIAGKLRQAVRQAAIVCDGESRRADLTLSGGTLAIAARSASHGQSRVEMPVPEGLAAAVAINHRFVEEALACLAPDAVVAVEVGGPETAVKLSAEAFECVVMPLNPEGE